MGYRRPVRQPQSARPGGPARWFGQGQNGNVILTGHNYNQGRYNWKGVFVNLQTLQPGDEITVDVQGDGQFVYVVESVNQVPWRDKSDAEWAQHVQYLGASGREQLTLVTCSGAAFTPSRPGSMWWPTPSP
ncbi:MAG: class F sortase [Anaerolineae bacterium]|nr:MAG: class F sortase [Anaerolineae bacterium]